MAITVGITHITHYKYDRPVSLSPQSIRLRPSPHNKVPIKSYSLKIKPKDHFLNWYQDIFGNFVANVVIPERTDEFKIEVDLKADINIINPFDFFIDKAYETWPFKYDDTTANELGNYFKITENGPLLKKWIDENITRAGIDKKNTIDLLVYLNQKLHESAQYIIRLEHGVYTPEQLFQLKQGSCRDFAWTLCQICRHLGIASRFVSGYLVQLKADIKSLEGPSGVEEDVVDLHAWAEVYIPGAGWVGLDATSGLFAGEGHIPLSASPLPHQSAPVDGMLEECKTTLIHTMKVARVYEAPRVTKPFSEVQWHDINKLAKKIDKEIKDSDMRLTIGGEPTFISTKNRDAAEWNTAALGEEKWEKAVKLLYALREKFAPTSSIHFSQGKWYGGEVLPRWALGCFYRKDKQPIWKNSEWIAEDKKNYHIKVEDAEKFSRLLINALGIPPECILTASEIGSDKPKGYVIPIIYSIKRKRWISNLWPYSQKIIKLIPGDSPIGYRLPLQLLPKVKNSDNEIPPERSNFEKLGDLPKRKELNEIVKARIKTPPKPKEISYLKTDEPGYVRTALCIEPRKGKLYLFMPPTYYAEHYLELSNAIESVCEKLKFPVLLEGYDPPKDLRLGNFYITPDPGVIEVNIQPGHNWDELKNINETVYDEVAKAGLTAEKFLTDGRRTGTGGGNHIIAGGSTPDDSPWMRRPDLLKSTISFWQNHPGLSYLFATIFIGPTSQAPRIDEARNDSLYELEIALSQIKPFKKMNMWLVDRLLRNILVDITGNTHRSEICIDKLYTPEAERGRLGLVEFRGFEMTPHARMNLLQILLLRALLTMFWNKPYEGQLIRWETTLHDKFMLPHFVWQDFCNVLSELEEYGFRFKPEWFLPQFNFRFPIYGTQVIDNIELELRMALEPWPVLGEENLSGATSRGVDSAMERLQLKVKGLDTNRYRITCNKYELELHDTDNKDIKVTGVKFKAWNPPFTLHPNLPVNTPLIFDIYDLQNKTSIGGCKYHVAHPGGRSYDTAPVNVNEAEGRMISRFEKIGHNSGKFGLKTLNSSKAFPYTNDLRRITIE